jgi:hypothetical protein
VSQYTIFQKQRFSHSRWGFWYGGVESLPLRHYQRFVDLAWLSLLHFFLVVSIVVSMDTKALTPLKVLGRELGGDYEQSTHSDLDEVGEDRR